MPASWDQARTVSPQSMNADHELHLSRLGAAKHRPMIVSHCRQSVMLIGCLTSFLAEQCEERMKRLQILYHPPHGRSSGVRRGIEGRNSKRQSIGTWWHLPAVRQGQKHVQGRLIHDPCAPGFYGLDRANTAPGHRLSKPDVFRLRQN